MNSSPQNVVEVITSSLCSLKVAVAPKSLDAYVPPNRSFDRTEP